MIPWAQLSQPPPPKRHLNRFSRFTQGSRTWPILWVREITALYKFIYLFTYLLTIQTDRPRYSLCSNWPLSLAITAMTFSENSVGLAFFLSQGVLWQSWAQFIEPPQPPVGSPQGAKFCRYPWTLIVVLTTLWYCRASVWCVCHSSHVRSLTQYK